MAVAEGAKGKGAEVSVITAAEFSPEQVGEYSAIAFGCPSMGSEQLEESEFEPMFTAVKPKLDGKMLVLAHDNVSNPKINSEVLLDDPAKGLIVEHNMWREMIWQQENSVLCVAADSYYDESDYIRDYDEFLEAVKGKDLD